MTERTFGLSPFDVILNDMVGPDSGAAVCDHSYSFVDPYVL